MHAVLSSLVTRAGLLGLAVFALSLLAVHLRPEGSPVAVWWPASAVAIGMLVLTPGRRERAVLTVVVLLASAVANAAAGRPATLALAFGAANAAEAAVATWLFTRATGGVSRFRSLDDAVRLLVAGVAGALTAGLLAAFAALAHGGSLVGTFAAVAPAHAAAVLLAVPVMLLGRRPGDVPARRLEAAVQWTALVLVGGYVFSPDQRLPLSFLVLPPLVWGAVRLPVRTCAVQGLLLGVGASVATLQGWGPLAEATDGPAAAVSLVQLFLVAHGLVLLPLSMAVQQRRLDVRLLRQREELFRLTFEEALVGMLMLQSSPEEGTLRIVQANDVAARLLRCERRQLAGRPLGELLDDGEREVLCRAADDLVTHDLGAWHGELSLTVQGQKRWLEAALYRLPSLGSAAVLAAQLVDVTERRLAERHLAHLALTDPLTGLANRVQLEQRAATLAHRDPAAVHALLFCDLDGFKAVNDTAGHAVGDAVLVEVARRLRRAARAQDVVARVGGDEFVLLCPEVSTPDDAGAIARHVADELAADVVVDGAAYRLGISVGIALIEAGGSFDAALRSADGAMYEAKAEQRRRLRSLDQDELVFSVN